MTDAPDAIRTQLVWNRLLAIVEEQAQTLMRTAFSTVVREAGDLSAGVFNTQGEMLAQAVTGTPGHVNAMAASVGKFLKRHPLASLEPGDVLLTNDPWDGTGHLNDFTVVTPVFRSGQPVGLFASTSHIADVGGRGFGPDASQVFEEGLNIPIGFLFRAGAANETLLSILAANVRDPVVAQGDLYSLAACNDAGGRQLLNTLDDFELPDLDSVGRAILETSERAMRREIAALPDGRHHYEMRVDGYDVPVDLRASLSIVGEALRINFAGTSGLSPFGINVPLAYTQAYASFGVRCIVGNDVPNNAGSLRCIDVSAPPGCILNALPPAAVSARHAIGQMLPDVVLGCLEQALPGQTPAEGASCIWNPVFLGAAQGTQGNNAPGEDFVINPIFNGGAGARPAKDGLSTTAFPSGVRTTPTEVNEATSPLVIWRKEYRPGSGGRGQYRGGHGQIIEIAHRDGVPFHISKMFDRIRFPARGRAGGEPGQPGRVYLKDGPDLPGKGKDLVPAGAVLVLETPGGGGMGSAEERDPEAVEKDREAGLEAKVPLHGVDFSGARERAGRNRKLWVASWYPDKASVVLECGGDGSGFGRCDLAQRILDHGGWWVVDFPFGPPAPVASAAGWNCWNDYLDWSRGGREPTELCDALRGSLESAGVRWSTKRKIDEEREATWFPFFEMLYRQTITGARDVLVHLNSANRKEACVLPFHGECMAAQPRSLVVEGFPGWTLRQLGLPDKGYKGKRPEARHARQKAADVLRKKGIPIGDAEYRRTIEDTEGDALDALILLYAAKLTQQRELTEWFPPETHWPSMEGWYFD